MRLLAAPDKFRGTAPAADVARAIGEAAWEAGWDIDELPLSDGGEGLLDVFGGPNRESIVAGPDHVERNAAWRLDNAVAIIEMAQASGLALVGGAQNNDPVEADTYGTGQLISAAVTAGAKHVIVGLGGSASTDGGLGAIRAIGSRTKLAGVTLTVACDVDIPFLDAARVFAPQKGASPAQVRLLSRRLDAVAQRYRDEFDVDVTTLSHGGAAGGLAGGLAAVGGHLVSGFDVVAETTELDTAIAAADLVVTGEGYVDAGSYNGKVVGGTVSLAETFGVPVLVIAGDVDPDVDGAPTVSLSAEFGAERSMADTLGCVRAVVARHLANWPGE